MDDKEDVINSDSADTAKDVFSDLDGLDLFDGQAVEGGVDNDEIDDCPGGGCKL